MKKENSLSDKRFCFESKGAYTHQGRYLEKDVKEFIKDVLEVAYMSKEDLIEFIKKRAGKDLV